MAVLRFREISRALADCRSCRQVAVITVNESRYVATWSERLSGRVDPQATRTATCSTCGVTYPVRSTDRTAAPAAGRDWADTRSRV